jgi:hypothetical protein
MGVKSSTSKPTQIQLRPSRLNTFVKSQDVTHKQALDCDSPIKQKAVEDRSKSPISLSTSRRSSRSLPKPCIKVNSININTVPIRRIQHFATTPTSVSQSSDFKPTACLAVKSTMYAKASVEDEIKVEQIENYEPYYRISPKAKRRAEVVTANKRNITLKLCKSSDSKQSKHTDMLSSSATTRDLNIPPRILIEGSLARAADPESKISKTLMMQSQDVKFIERSQGTKTLAALSKTSNPVFKEKLPLLKSPFKEENKQRSNKQYKLVFKNSSTATNSTAPQDISLDKSLNGPRVLWRGKFGAFQHTNRL